MNERLDRLEESNKRLKDKLEKEYKITVRIEIGII